MRLEALVDGRIVRVEVNGEGGRYTVVLDDRTLAVDARATGPRGMSLIVDGESHAAGVERRPGGYIVHLREDTLEVDLDDPGTAAAAAPRRAAAGPVRVAAPMPGRLLRVLVEPGQEVSAGQGLVVMEAMKMENELRAPRAGRVAEVHARERQTVETGALLVILD
ncbi:MAG TPA: biotin/lipoyl-containing protein [Vicinamibacteria bacterium]|nr:biotin/lipoyl-containing protein [Vicinamibacteria bacterium]